MINMRLNFHKILAIINESQHKRLPMKAEIETLSRQIKQSQQLLRRYL